MENAIFNKLSQYSFQAVNQDYCVGVWNNYAVTLQRFSGRSYYVYLAIRIPKSSSVLKKALKTAIKAAGVKKAAVGRVMPNFVQTTFSFGRVEDELTALTDFLNTLTAALQENGVAPANTCAATGAPDPDSLCLVLRQDCFGFQPVCGAAIRQNDYEVQARAEENESNGSYLTGFIGALLGMLVGVAVNLLTLYFMQRIFAVLFALVPIAAMFGYKLLKGKTDKMAMVIVILLSILAVPLMEYLLTVLSLVREYAVPAGEAAKLTAQVFFDPEVLSDTLPEMGKMLLFMALGVFIGWSYMRSQLNTTQVRGAKLQTETLRPNPLYQGRQ